MLKKTCEKTIYSLILKEYYIDKIKFNFDKNFIDKLTKITNFTPYFIIENLEYIPQSMEIIDKILIENYSIIFNDFKSNSHNLSNKILKSYSSFLTKGEYDAVSKEIFKGQKLNTSEKEDDVTIKWTIKECIDTNEDYLLKLAHAYYKYLTNYNYITKSLDDDKNFLELSHEKYIDLISKKKRPRQHPLMIPSKGNSLEIFKVALNPKILEINNLL